MSFFHKIIETKLILGLHILSSVVKFTCKIFAIHDCNSDNNNKNMKNTKTIGNQIVRKYLGTRVDGFQNIQYDPNPYGFY